MEVTHTATQPSAEQEATHALATTGIPVTYAYSSHSPCTQRLFRYISGENANKTKVEMTAPVRVMLEAGEGPFCKDHFKVSFFVPFHLQVDAVGREIQNAVFHQQQAILNHMNQTTYLKNNSRH